MERWRPLGSWETGEANRIIRNNYRNFTQPSFRRAFRDITSDELSMIFNIGRGQAQFLVDSYLELFQTPPSLGSEITSKVSLDSLLESTWHDAASPEISLEQEHTRQARIMAQLFAKVLGMSEEEYIGILPSFPNKPNASDYFTGLRPLIVEGTRIAWRKQALLSGIEVKIDGSNDDANGWRYVERWTSGKVIIPEKPFTTWVLVAPEWHHFDHKFDPVGIRECFAPEDRFGIIAEGVAYHNAYFDIARRGRFNLFGSRNFNDNGGEIPYLNCQSKPVSINAYRLDDYARKGLENPRCHTLVSRGGIRT